MSSAVRSVNLFDLLNEDDEGMGAIPTPKPQPAAPKPAAAAAPAAAAPAARAQNSNARGGARGGAAARTNTRGPREPRAQDPDATVGEKLDDSRRNGHKEGGARGGAGARGPRRGAGTGAGAASHGGFDRKSGGHADSQKKVDQGWGADTGAAELAAETEGAADAKADVLAATPGAATPAGEGATTPKEATEDKKAEKPEVVEEEVDNTQTYAEYLAAKAATAIEGVASLAKRVVGDWEGGGEVVKKTEEEALFAVKEKEQKEKVKKEKKEKVKIEIEGRFAPPVRDGPTRGRGGFRGGEPRAAGSERRERPEGGAEGAPRGGARGGRGGRGGARGGAARGGAAAGGAAPRQAKATPVVDVDDQSAFPSLS